MDEQAKKWLEEHSHELPPEEIPLEDEKVRCDNSWPEPIPVPNMGIFSQITSQESFNEIVGNPENWHMISMRPDLYKSWIVPHAAILFGKAWFDRVKWRRSIHKGVPFPLFTDAEKRLANEAGHRLDDTTHGRAIIARIVEKIEYALGVYIEGKWLKNSNQAKRPGGYIIDSIKNEFVREIGTELGYKLRNVLACPYCLCNKISQKTPLVRYGPIQYSCPKCEERCKNLEYMTQDTEDLDSNACLFKKFVGITCICPSNECKGKFVPLNSIDFENWHVGAPKLELAKLGKTLRTISVSKNVYAFTEPPASIAQIPLVCPFCSTKFTPLGALKSKSGFKNHSGFLTGLPSISIWEQRQSATLDRPKNEDMNDFSPKNNIVSRFVDIDNQILAKQNVKLLIDEIICNMARIKKDSVAGFTTWCFFLGTIRWMAKYWQDAFAYFFNWSIRERNMTAKEMRLYPGENKKRMTDVVRGQTASIHQALFYNWMDVIEENISTFTILNPNIRELADFRWFCRPPKFSGGPKSMFHSVVNSKLKIPNATDIINLQSQRFSPRIAKVYSIRKIENGQIGEYEFKNDIKFCEWQAIQMTDCGLDPNDTVKVEALIMPGHTTHAPIQRIIRLRTKVLASLIQHIHMEESKGVRDADFWRIWKNKVARAKKVIDLDIDIKE